MMEHDYHFAIIKEICKFIMPIADSIACFEESSTTLDQNFGELIKVYTIIKDTDVTENYSNLKSHMIRII